MTKMADVMMHQIDSDTLAEISRAHDNLVQCVDWLLQRRDLEAVERLMPIVESIGNRLTAVYESSYPEIVPCVEVINRFSDEMVQRFIQARTSNERKALLKYVTIAIERWSEGSEEPFLETAPAKRFAA